MLIHKLMFDKKSSINFKLLFLKYEDIISLLFNKNLDII